MSPSRIKTFLDQSPFEPFAIIKGDGGAVNVLSRELALLYPGGRSLHVVSPKFAGAKTEDEFEDHFIDVFLVTDVVKPPRRLNSKKR